MRVAWWLVVAWAVHRAVRATLEFLGCDSGYELGDGLLFYGGLLAVVLVHARGHADLRWSEVAPRRGMPLGLVVPIAVLSAAGLLLNQQSIRFCELLNVFSPEFYGDFPDEWRLESTAHHPPLLESLVSRAVLPAVFEETLFRGIVLTALATTMSKRRAIAISSLYFAVVHLRLERMPDTFAMGAVYGWLFVRTGSLLPGMLAHFLHNSGCDLLSRMDSIPGVPPEWVAFDRYGLLPAWTVVAAAGLAISSLVMIRKIARTAPVTGAGARPWTTLQDAATS